MQHSAQRSQVSRCDPATPVSTCETDNITVCICTYQRPILLDRLLRALAVQQTNGTFSYSCVVVDNDALESARKVVERWRPNFPVTIQYEVEPARNIAVARNRALQSARGNLIAFIDDDEVPQKDWLCRLRNTLAEYDADVVLGPVRPYFDEAPPQWLLKSGLCRRESLSTGSKVHWRRTRTGNLLMRAQIVNRAGILFDPAYGTGGEDVDFFRRAAGKGKVFVWCEEAPVYELVSGNRLQRRYYIERALLQGRISLRYAMNDESISGLVVVGVKALAAILIYTCALPFLFIAARHLGIKYLIKDCHHISRLLAIFGVGDVSRRDF
jgi:succinoglycan biosynthesis protein ExoM